MRSYTSLPWIEKPVLAYGVQRSPITMIVLHSTAGTAASAIAWFNNPQAGTSAHYVIDNKGQLYAMLEEYLSAWHAGDYNVNLKSIGIEHEGYTGLVRSDKEYATSAKLVADICKYYGIACDRAHIKAHREIVSTQCPTDLDVDRIVREAKAILTPAPSPIEVITTQVKQKVNTSVSDDSFKAWFVSYIGQQDKSTLRNWLRKILGI